jgi:antitoxin component of MazEF toxin-antitoxin module
MTCQVHVDSAPDGSSTATRLPSPLMSDLQVPSTTGAQLLSELSNQELLHEILKRCQQCDRHAWALQGNVAAAALVEGAVTAQE